LIPNFVGDQSSRVAAVLRGALAASITPLRDGGASLDEDAFGPVVDFLAAGGLDGLLAMGTNGEGILLSVSERRRAAELFVAASRGRLQVAVHCGAQTTADTVELATHAAEQGADGVAVIAPPYFVLDDAALLEHFATAAAACSPLPFYVYEFAQVSGYAVPLSVLQRLRDRAPNLAGLKVSDRPWEKFAPYLIEGLDVFVGPEALIGQGLERGAAGAVSALAAAFPELIAAAVRGEPVEVGDLRERIDGRFPRHAAFKHILARRGVPVREDVRAPLRKLTAEERLELDAGLEPWLRAA
jgi:dihydrodipicolinate synthase/N-acetylneuraminate lyase